MNRDELKRLWVADQRGIDLVALAVALFDGRPVLTRSCDREPEERYATLGEIEGKFSL
jgi:uncharacterized DUF497 family protein